MKTFYKLFAAFLVLVSVSANAQQLTTPMIFKVNSPLNVAGSYDYGYPTNWGPVTIQTTTGNLAWGFTANGDSLACTPIVTNMTGKIALARRGACSFSLKAYHNQQAGAIGTVIINSPENATPNAIVNMLGGDSASAVFTPAVFLPLDVATPITNEVDAGNMVAASFFVPQIDGAQALFHYFTPQDQILTMDSIRVTVYNNSSTDETGVVATVKIVEPNGNVVNLSETVGTLTANTNGLIKFAQAYTPSDLGEYSMTFKVISNSGNYAADSVVQNFEVTDYTWGNDNGDIIGGISPANWATTFRYDVGNYYFTGANSSVVTHMSFGLENPDSVDGETFDIIFYEIPAGTSLATATYSDLTTVAFASYTVDAANMPANDTVVVELNPLSGSAITLNPNSLYLITVQYDAFLSPNGNTSVPEFLHSGPTDYQFINTHVYTTGFSSWNGGWNAVVRVHEDGFVIPIGTEEIEILNDTKMAIFPNPASDFVTLDLDLENTSSMVDVKIIDINGRVLQSETYNNVQRGQYTYDVKGLAAGNYFIRVQTDEGFNTKHFIVVKNK